MTLILASASPARQAMLAASRIPFTAELAGVDERAVEIPLLAGGASPADVAAALAEAKALAVSARSGDAFVIGADQTLDLDGARWTKPVTIPEAREQIARLSGRTHRLHAAAAVARDGTVQWLTVASAALTMRPLTAAAIDAYLAEVGEAALASVGSYQIEGPGIRLFEAFEGDTFTIRGLPLVPLLAYLRGAGAIAW